MIPLFEHYPLLGKKLPYCALGKFPTPVEKCARLGERIGLDQLYIKRDDVSGNLYGGNKVRKLEFLLGHGPHSKAREVLTFGFAGSNHALATAVYAHQLGLKSISMLMPQLNAYYVRFNLLMSFHYNAELHQHRNVPLLAMGAMYQLLRHKISNGRFPQWISAGGSSPLGTIGYVNAALELKEQIKGGEIPEPDRIYVPFGTMGTTVGLILGLKALKLKSRVIPVRVADEQFANAKKMVKLFNKTNALLLSGDPSFPNLELTEKEREITHRFFGKGYAQFMEEGMEAVSCMEETEGIKLDGTYTGKTLAALINDAGNQNLREKVILFWNTYNSRDFTDKIADIDYRQLPQCFHRYFEEEVQSLDKSR